MSTQPAPDQFMQYFRANYPGPNTIISNPDWHAPKIYNAAIAASAERELRRAVLHLLRRITSDPRLAYYFDPCTESFQLLIDAYSKSTGRDPEELRAEIKSEINTERPRCRECPHCRQEAQ